MTTADAEERQVSRGHRVELDPTSEKADLFQKHADAARWAYNWGLERKIAVMDLNQLPIERIKIPTAIDLHREVVRLKRTTHPWLAAVSKWAPQMALRDLEMAFKNFYERRADFPRFKSRKRDRPSFHLGGNAPTSPNLIEITGGRVKLPIAGWVCVKHGDVRYIPPVGVKINSATVAKVAGRWFLSLQANVPQKEPKPVVGPVVGIDRGIGGDNFMVISDGKSDLAIKSPRPPTEAGAQTDESPAHGVAKTQRLQAAQESLERLQRVHLRISNVRRDFTNKTRETCQSSLRRTLR